MSNLKPLSKNILTISLQKIYIFVVWLKNISFKLFPSKIKKTGIFTISVGGIKTGGTGKTPLAMIIANYFNAQQITPVILSRGYGRKNKRMVIVKAHEHCSWEDCGDEPSMIHYNIPHSWLGIYPDRFASACAIKKQITSPFVQILDDGFQHQKLHRDVNIVTLPSTILEDTTFPCGYMREPLSSLNRADIICLIGMEKELEKLLLVQQTINEIFPHKEIFLIYQKPLHWVNYHTKEISSKPSVSNGILVSGIAAPHRFIEEVSKQSIPISKKVIFPDHHIFSSEDINSLLDNTIDGIITTEKDIIRLNSINFVKSLNIWYLKITLDFFNLDDLKKFNALIQRKYYFG